MTAGITGVFWFPRLSEGNSFALHAGTHAVPMTAAATAWGALAGAWGDATATAVRVMAELGVGMQSFNGVGALARLSAFTLWAEQQTALATAMSTKAATNATAYTVAALAMPSPPEIAAVNAARAAAHTTGGMLNGSAEIAEGAKKLMDLRAALTMETYEAAVTATVVTPGQFIAPPPIANGAGQADAGEAADEAFQAGKGDPVQAAMAAASAIAQNPAVSSTVTQAANVAGSVATTGVSTAGNAGANAIAAVTGNTSSSVAPMAPMVAGVGAGAGAGAAATRSASMTGAPTGLNNGSMKLPEGWGAPPSNGGGAPSAPAVEGTAISRTEGMPVRPGTTAPGNPLLGNSRGTTGDDESEHDGTDYLLSDHFTDGRYTADGVIGGEPPRTGR